MPNNHDLIPTEQHCQPYLGENPEQFEYQPVQYFRPPDWQGWALIALIFVLIASAGKKNTPEVSSLHLKARPENAYQPTYPRFIPPTPPPGNEKIVFPPVE